jgi:hypothetical protein
MRFTKRQVREAADKQTAELKKQVENLQVRLVSTILEGETRAFYGWLLGTALGSIATCFVWWLTAAGFFRWPY